MTTNAIDTSARRRRRPSVPHLPAIARDPLDDAREVLAAFAAKQSGSDATPYADLAEDLAAALRTALRLLCRPPAKPVLRPLSLLDVAQAEKFLIDLECRILGADASRIAFLLGQAESHLQNMVELVRTVTELPR